MIRTTFPSGKIYDAFILETNEELLRVIINKEIHTVRYFLNHDKISIWSKYLGKFEFYAPSIDQRNILSDQVAKKCDGRIISSMHCKINQIMVRPGDRVQIGTPLCVTEAMKMEVCKYIINFNL